MAFQRSHMRMTHPNTDDSGKKVNMATNEVDSGPDTNQNKNPV